MDLNIVIVLVSVIFGAGLGFLYRKNILEKHYANLEKEGEKLIKDSEHEAHDILRDAKRKVFEAEKAMKREEQSKMDKVRDLEKKLHKKELDLDKKLDSVEQKKDEIAKNLSDIKSKKIEVEETLQQHSKELEKIAGYSREEAKELMLKKVGEEYKDDIILHVKEMEKAIKKDAEEKAKHIIVDAMQRCVSETTAEVTTTMVSLPSDDLKGRIIGREGRNIQAFEQVTGIDVIVDDTPGSIMISGFDLVRRYIAKVALERLLEDGRIHPGRIEECVDKVKEEVGGLIKELGEKAVMETGVVGLHPDLVRLVGRLKFYTTNGQNVLKHSIEVAYIASALASELGADVNICLRAGLLHSIGRTVDQEVQGHHSTLGRDIAKKYGVSEPVCHCIESYMNIVEPKSLEAKIVQVASLISTGRPGATRDNLEQYVKRLTELEDIAMSFDGVNKCYAVHAGKEVRVFIDPDKIDDLGSIKLSYKIARKIEQDLQFPGEIKVHVIREKRLESFAK